ncbi:UNVERIFIED_ORG: hypothetical protein GGD47_002481 [Rhizobium etli]
MDGEAPIPLLEKAVQSQPLPKEEFVRNALSGSCTSKQVSSCLRKPPLHVQPEP